MRELRHINQVCTQGCIADSAHFALTNANRYGMFNFMVYGVFIWRKDNKDTRTETKLRCRSRFGEDLEEFSQRGLKFRCT